MDVTRNSAPRWMWLDADRLVRDALADLEKGRSVSIPSTRYKLLATIARCTPASVQARFQGLGQQVAGWRSEKGRSGPGLAAALRGTRNGRVRRRHAWLLARRSCHGRSSAS